MRLPANQARAFVFGPPELGERLVSEFKALGIQAELAATPLNEFELVSWLSARPSDASTFIHPGLSFWADRPEFPQLVSGAGFFPVSPSASLVSLCLNKLNVALEAEAAGIPTLALGLDPLSSLREIEAQLEKSGESFPIVLKSLKVAQGHGIQVIRSLPELREVVPIWFEQLIRRYSNASIIIERCLPSARHVIIPFAADGARFTKVFAIVDASLQTRWRRMIQFIPAEGIDPKAAVALHEYVHHWVRHLAFSGFGSLEFLIEGDRVYLIDATARMNTSFPLWEELTGIDSVEWQLASLGQLPIPVQKPVSTEPSELGKNFGAGIALRFYAEDPVRQIPCPGLIRERTDPFRKEYDDPSSTAIWMTRYEENQEVLWTSSGVIGELFVFAADRKSCLKAARKVIREIWIAGSVQTNQRFLLEHLEHPFVRENLIHAGFTDEDFVPEGFPPVEVVHELAGLADLFFPLAGARWISGNYRVPPNASGVPQWSNRTEFTTAGRLTGFTAEITHSDGVHRVLFEPLTEDRWLVHFKTWSIPLRRMSPPQAPKEVRSVTRKILALAPGRIHALLRQPGEILEPGDRACMLESIGILVPHAVPIQVRLLEWKVEVGEVVEAGRELAVLELLR